METIDTMKHNTTQQDTFVNAVEYYKHNNLADDLTYKLNSDGFSDI
jgi:hypothetical protein